MKTKVFFVFAAALLLSTMTGATVSAVTKFEPVAGIQVVIQQDTEDKNNPGYRGARPTDNTGGAAFANIEAGKYTVTLKRFTKIDKTLNISITSSNGVKMSDVWESAKKDTFKTTMEIKGGDMYMVDVKVTTADGAPATED